MHDDDDCYRDSAIRQNTSLHLLAIAVAKSGAAIAVAKHLRDDLVIANLDSVGDYERALNVLAAAADSSAEN